jgi:CBS domain containing-hemolysin-like protein
MNDHPSNPKPRNNGTENKTSLFIGLLGWIRGVGGAQNGEDSVRNALEELIEEREEAEVPIDEDERILLANILELRGRTIHDIMVPRANIASVSRDSSLSELIDLLTKESHSRLPVYGETLDDVAGMVHIKDVLAWRGRDGDFSLSKIQRKILFVSPSMQVLELLLKMRAERSHMALVVDEFGGVDGLVTIEDLVEEIVGEIEDEHDLDDNPKMISHPDGSFTADARVTIGTLEEMTGTEVTGGDTEDIDTLGGLVFSIAGRVPVRGELLHHSSGVEFEVLDADHRRIKFLRVLKPEPSRGRQKGD